MPDPDCYRTIGEMEARIERLENENDRLRRSLADLVHTRAKIGGAVWALSLVIGSALAALAHLFDLPAMMKKLIAM